MCFRLVPKSTTLDDPERRIQGLPKVFKYPFISGTSIATYTSNFVRTFLGSIGTKVHFFKSSRGRSQGLPKILGHRYIGRIARLSLR